MTFWTLLRWVKRSSSWALRDSIRSEAEDCWGVRGRALEFVDGAIEEVGLCLGWSKVGVATGLRLELMFGGGGDGEG